jgi:hypothetical protein
MLRPLPLLGQLVVYVLVALALGYFSDRPAYRHYPADRAQLTLSFTHVGQHVGACRKLTREEIAETAANMRRAVVCPRERLPLLVELALSGEVIYRDTLPPTGLSSDGAAQAYQRFSVAPGSYHIEARLRDSGRSEGFDYSAGRQVDLSAGENYVIDFRSEMGGFIFGAGRNSAQR